MRTGQWKEKSCCPLKWGYSALSNLLVAISWQEFSNLRILIKGYGNQKLGYMKNDLGWERRRLGYFQMLEVMLENILAMCLATEKQSLHCSYTDALLHHYNQWLSNSQSLPHHNTGKLLFMKCSSKGCKSTSSTIKKASYFKTAVGLDDLQGFCLL